MLRTLSRSQRREGYDGVMSITRASMFFIVSFVLAAAAPAAVADEVQPNPPTGISPSAVPLQGDPPDPLGLPLDESEDQKIRKELQRRGNPDPLPPDMIGPDREPFRILPDGRRRPFDSTSGRSRHIHRNQKCLGRLAQESRQCNR